MTTPKILIACGRELYTPDGEIPVAVVAPDMPEWFAEELARRWNEFEGLYEAWRGVNGYFGRKSGW